MFPPVEKKNKNTLLLKNANHQLTKQGCNKPSIIKKTQYLQSTIK